MCVIFVKIKELKIDYERRKVKLFQPAFGENLKFANKSACTRIPTTEIKTAIYPESDYTTWQRKNTKMGEQKSRAGTPEWNIHFLMRDVLLDV